MLRDVIKRDGRIERFNVAKIVNAIMRAAAACGGENAEHAKMLAEEVSDLLQCRFCDRIPHVENLQDMIEEVLIKAGHDQTAKAFILYREKRKRARDLDALVAASTDMFADYLEKRESAAVENGKSLGGLHTYLQHFFTRQYWLHQIYPEDVRHAHEEGRLHLHDLGFLGPHLAGWDTQRLLLKGFRVSAKGTASRPPKHLSSFLGQLADAVLIAGKEIAGTQSWNSIDTFAAPLIRKDALSFEEVKQEIEAFVCRINTPLHPGANPLPLHLSFDFKIPAELGGAPVIIGGRRLLPTYAEYQPEADLFNRAFSEVMMEGDAKGGGFVSPSRTIPITKDFDWESETLNLLMRTAGKPAQVYFLNTVFCDAVREPAWKDLWMPAKRHVLKKRGHPASNPMSGSIGAVSINLVRIAYGAHTEDEFFAELTRVAKIAKTSLETKRKLLEKQCEQGLYPYSAYSLAETKEKSGSYWSNHFSTIGVVGMNECLINFLNTDLAAPEGQRFALKIMHFLRRLVLEFQLETGHFYSLEEVQGEEIGLRLAQLDKKRFPKIITAGDKVPDYTVSTQLPTGLDGDIFRAVALQEELQALYTGGAALHWRMSEETGDLLFCKKLIRKIFMQSKIPSLSLHSAWAGVAEYGGYGVHYIDFDFKKHADVVSLVEEYLQPAEEMRKEQEISGQSEKIFDR